MTIKDIDTNAHYFILMHPDNYYYFFNLVVRRKNYTGRQKWVECELQALEGSKYVTLHSVEKNYGNEIFTRDKFLMCLEDGTIIKKEFEDMKCVEEEWIEPLYRQAYVKHSAYTLKRVPKKEN